MAFRGKFDQTKVLKTLSFSLKRRRRYLDEESCLLHSVWGHGFNCILFIQRVGHGRGRSRRIVLICFVDCLRGFYF